MLTISPFSTILTCTSHLKSLNIKKDTAIFQQKYRSWLGIGTRIWQLVYGIPTFPLLRIGSPVAIHVHVYKQTIGKLYIFTSTQDLIINYVGGDILFLSCQSVCHKSFLTTPPTFYIRNPQNFACLLIII